MLELILCGGLAFGTAMYALAYIWGTKNEQPLPPVDHKDVKIADMDVEIARLKEEVKKFKEDNRQLLKKLSGSEYR